MKRWVLVIALICLVAGTASADVANEVTVGLEVDGTSKATDSAGVDITDKVDNDNSLFTVRYTHFFAPLKEDGKPVDLRQFYQHPSTLSAGLVFLGSKNKDNTIPGSETNEEMSAAVFQVGGEYVFPTNTGLFLSVGFGGGTFKQTIGGVSQPEVDIAHSSLDLGVRQYLLPELALYLRYHGESTKNKQSGIPDETNDKGVTYLGARGVISDVVGLMLELGGGKRELEAGGSTSKFDVKAVNAEIAGYIGKQLTIRLAVEAESEDLNGMPAGIEHTTTTTRTTLAGRYWFSERFGMELPLYSEKVEHKTVFPGGEFKDEVTNTGIGLYAAFRF